MATLYILSLSYDNNCDRTFIQLKRHVLSFGVRRETNKFDHVKTILIPRSSNLLWNIEIHWCVLSDWSNLGDNVQKGQVSLVDVLQHRPHAKCKRILKINPGMSLWSGTGERTNRWSGWKPDWLNDATLRHFWGLGVATFNPTTLVCKASAINWYLAKDSLFWWTSTYAGLLRLSNFKLGPKWNLEFQTLPVLRFDKTSIS